jgi:intracellular sulfur oxidation DsrE/DsrF family protein
LRSHGFSAYKDIVDDEDIPTIKKAQESIRRLAKEKKVKIIACAMSWEANAIEPKEVLPFVTISENSFIDTIGYQNNGYALMTFK